MVFHYIALSLTMVIWGLSFVATKIALTGFSMFSLVFIRFSLSALFFVGLMAWKGFPRFSLSDHVRLLTTAIFEPWLYFMFETSGIQHTTASKASLIIAVIPLVVVLLSRIFLKEKTGWVSLVAIFISLIGIGILVTGGGGSGLESASWGDLLMFGAVLSAAIYTISIRSLSQRFSPLHITGFQMIYGALLFAPEFFWQLDTVSWEIVTAPAVGALVMLILFASIGAFMMYNFALSQIPAAKASLFLNGIPVVTALGAWVLLDEVLTPLQWVGGAIVLIAVYLTSLDKRRNAGGVSSGNASTTTVNGVS